MNKQAVGIVILVIVSVAVGIALPVTIYNASDRLTKGLRWAWENEFAREQRKFYQELEKERQRMQEVKDTIERYKKELGKDYAAILRADMDEFKKARGEEKFRERFDYDAYEYEVYEENPLSDNQLDSLPEKPWSLYEDMFGGGTFSTDINNEVISEEEPAGGWGLESLGGL